jgi:hypothetical protein
VAISLTRTLRLCSGATSRYIKLPSRAIQGYQDGGGVIDFYQAGTADMKSSLHVLGNASRRILSFSSLTRFRCQTACLYHHRPPYASSFLVHRPTSLHAIASSKVLSRASRDMIFTLRLRDTDSPLAVDVQRSQICRRPCTNMRIWACISVLVPSWDGTACPQRGGDEAYTYRGALL